MHDFHHGFNCFVLSPESYTASKSTHFHLSYGSLPSLFPSFFSKIFKPFEMPVLQSRAFDFPTFQLSNEIGSPVREGDGRDTTQVSSLRRNDERYRRYRQHSPTKPQKELKIKKP